MIVIIMHETQHKEESDRMKYREREIEQLFKTLSVLHIDQVIVRGLELVCIGIRRVVGGRRERERESWRE